jgi:hypothetical protein
LSFASFALGKDFHLLLLRSLDGLSIVKVAKLLEVLHYTFCE